MDSKDIAEAKRLADEESNHPLAEQVYTLVYEIERLRAQVAPSDEQILAGAQAREEATNQEERKPMPKTERHWSLDDDEAVQALMDRDMED